MKTTISGLLVGIALTVVGCATGGPMEDGAKALKIETTDSETTISVPSTENQLLISSPRGGLLAGATDDSGNIVLAAVVDAEGKPSFAVFDSQRIATAKLGLSNDLEPLLFMNGENEKSWIVLGMDPNGLPQLNLVTEDIKTGPRTRFSFKTVDGVTTPYMVMRSGQGDYAQKSSFNASGAPTFEMIDAKGRVRVRIGLGEGDKPYFELLDEEGRQTWAAK